MKIVAVSFMFEDDVTDADAVSWLEDMKADIECMDNSPKVHFPEDVFNSVAVTAEYKGDNVSSATPLVIERLVIEDDEVLHIIVRDLS